MKPRVTPDFLRGVMALYALKEAFVGESGIRSGLHPFQAVQLFGSILVCSLYAFVLWAMLFPSRKGLQAAFVLLASLVLISALSAFYWVRHLHGYVPPFGWYCDELFDTAAAATAWFLYRREPRKPS